MATRRPRVKVAANLSIRRPPKINTANVAVDLIKQEVPVTASAPAKEADIPHSVALLPPVSKDIVAEEIIQTGTLPTPKPDVPSEEPFQDFKLPKPVDDVAKVSSYPEPNTSTANTFHNGDEPMSPRKQDSRPTFTLPLARKRNRTESLTSNKSLPEGVTVNKVTRKVATKQEESQRTLENKKEIRKRLTNIENVNKQNLTMFDMIYYNPINNPMTLPALSKRGSLENIPKSVDGRERDGVRSRSVSKSRSPTPAPSGSAPVPSPIPAAPVQLTPQLKLGPNGEMILDEASLVIENEREKEMRETLANTDIVYQDEYSGNSGYYSRIRRTKDWADEETIRFYRCLHTIGTDFSMMLTLFPQRSRRDLKLKFKKEERLNLRLVNKALLHPKEFNVDELRQQFAEEDEQLEKQRQEEKQRKMESMEQHHKEQLRKKLMLQMSTSNNPQRRLSKSERVMADGSELLGVEIKKPKRKAPSKKRTSAKPVIVTLPAIADAEQAEEQQQVFGTVSEVNTMGLLCNSANSLTIDIVPKESFKKRKRTPTPKKRATAKLDSSTIKTNAVESKVEQQVESILEINQCIAADTDNTSVEIAADAELSKETARFPASKKRDTAKLASTKVTSDMLQEQQQQHLPEFVPERHTSPHRLVDNANNVPVNTAIITVTSECSTNSSSLNQPIGSTSPVPASSNVVEKNDQQPVESMSEENVLVLMEEPKNTSNYRTSGAKRGAKKLSKVRKRKPKIKKQFTRKAVTTGSVALKGADTKEQADCAVVIKKDVTEDVAPEGNVSNNPVSNNPNEPFVSYEPAAATYDNANIDLPAVKYQCMDDIEVDGYEISDEIMNTANYDDADGTDAAAANASSANAVVQNQEDDSITVITLQNLDDQTHTTCIRTDVGQTLEPTMINELTPVEIKYDEYDAGSQLVLPCGENLTKAELCNVQHHNTNANTGPNTGGNSATANAQMIDWPPVTVPTTESIPYIVYEKLEYGSSSGTVIIPDILPDKATAFKGQSAQYTTTGQGFSNVPMLEQKSSTAAAPALVHAVDDLQNKTSCYTTVANSSPKQETLSDVPRREDPQVSKYEVFDTGVSGKEIEEEEEEEEDDGGFSLEDIDINSLVLVESQDSVDPNRTFYEIYVSNPDTGQLSEKPLDVPADVIENIRQILEAGER
ncbi:transcription factor TFIIIB component B'' homolog [Anopheles funestus]|uniref:transcription factor TFIIIB component B'' homolog n=1 Tax=Anopheles funestus TaxID=62324 RepID=UPI0020C67493|nr:transcription factor TFIIIB component B'' homolog [Anopheles funestus]